MSGGGDGAGVGGAEGVWGGECDDGGGDGGGCGGCGEDVGVRLGMWRRGSKDGSDLLRFVRRHVTLLIRASAYHFTV